MGTRGLVGFVVDGDVKITYNHFDSYPEGLGESVLSALRDMPLPEIKTLARNLVVVRSDSKPTPEQVKKCQAAGAVDLEVSKQSLDDWYCLLRNTQGDIPLLLRTGFIEDSTSFAADSLFCEWGYVIDLDSDQLEVYRGFQTTPHRCGRFAGMKPPRDGEYWPIKLIVSFPLDSLPERLDSESLDPQEDS